MYRKCRNVVLGKKLGREECQRLANTAEDLAAGRGKVEKVLGYGYVSRFKEEEDRRTAKAKKALFLPFFHPGVWGKFLNDTPAVGRSDFNIGDGGGSFRLNESDRTPVGPEDPWISGGGDRVDREQRPMNPRRGACSAIDREVESMVVRRTETTDDADAAVKPRSEFFAAKKLVEREVLALHRNVLRGIENGEHTIPTVCRDGDGRWIEILRAATRAKLPGEKIIERCKLIEGKEVLRRVDMKTLAERNDPTSASLRVVVFSRCPGQHRPAKQRVQQKAANRF